MNHLALREGLRIRIVGLTLCTKDKAAIGHGGKSIPEPHGTRLHEEFFPQMPGTIMSPVRLGEMVHNAKFSDAYLYGDRGQKGN